MPKIGKIAALFLIVSTLVVLPVHAQQPTAVVRGYLFYSENCPSCRQVRDEVIASLYLEHGTQLQIRAIEITGNEASFRWLEAAQQAYKVPMGTDVPLLFIGDTYLTGDEIAVRLPGLVREYIEQGGVDYPDIPPPEGVPTPTVQFSFFSLPDCPHCQNVKEQVFPRVRQKYGDRVQWTEYDTSQEANLRALIELGKLVNLPQARQGSVPVVFVGDQYTLYRFMIGDAQIAAELEPMLDWYLEVGGAGLPDWWDQLLEFSASPLSGATPTPPAPDSEPIHLAYFAEAGCSDCDLVSAILDVVQDRYPALVVHQFDIVADARREVCLSEQLGVPEDRRHDAPAIYVGQDYLIDADITLDATIALLAGYVETGAPATWESCAEDIELPPPPPWWAVILPGLIDGINPCAFATIVFFISYLTLVERKGRDIILVGVAFTLSIFISYLGFGLGLRQLLAGLIDTVGQVLRVILNLLIAVMCIVLAIVSLADFRKARRGRTRDMALRLPNRLRRWINDTVRRNFQSQSLPRLIVTSFLTGVVVSFIELTCTGQVYVPIILGLTNPAYRGHALLALTIYCLAFIVPLIVVFVVSYMGTNSRQLGMVLQRHTATVKLATALLFLGMGIWLLYEVLRVWLATSPALT